MKHYKISYWDAANSELRARTRRVGKCLREGAKTVTIFSDMRGVRRRIASDGVASDWMKVGADLWAAVAAEKARREREAG